jgi:CPA1 family monovalent cation:H+ antiporter
MPSETIFILLFVIATAVAMAVRRLKIPYTVALVVAGLILGLLHAFRPPHLTKALLFSVFLPGLLFEAAFHIDFQQFWRNRLTILSLAVPGVIAATALTTVILTSVADTLDYVQGFSWHYALVFGALIAATDPIAVVALFKELGAPKRLSILVEGESLLNDGTGIVFFTLSLSLAAGGNTTVSGLALDFFSIAGVGLVIGAGIGLAVSQVTKQVDDPMIEITLTTIAAYGAFVTAEHFHYSGVIATVTAGMFCGNYGARIGMSPSTRLAIESFWQYIAFALNSIVFLLIGLEVQIRQLLVSWKMILVAYLAVTGARALVIFGASLLLRGTREKIPWSWSAVLTWGGLRGALPMVLVLSLPASFPNRDLLVTMTFGVVLISILVHGVTVSRLMRWLRIVEGHEAREAYEFIQGKIQAAGTALAELKQMAGPRLKNSSVYSKLRREYEAVIRSGEEQIDSLPIDQEQLREEEMQQIRRHLLLAERRQILEAFHQGVLGQRVQEKLLADVDQRLLRLETEGDNHSDSEKKG